MLFRGKEGSVREKDRRVASCLVRMGGGRVLEGGPLPVLSVVARNDSGSSLG
jgi:hypothetical protein